MSIWKQEIDLTLLNAMGKNTVNEFVDFKFIEVGDDYLKGSMPVNERTKQPFGILHGGMSVVMAETLGSVASYFCIKDTKTHTAVGIEINANHLRSVRSGLVYGIVKPIRIGRNLHVWQIEIRDDKDRLVCTSRLTTMVIAI